MPLGSHKRSKFLDDTFHDEDHKRIKADVPLSSKIYQLGYYSLDNINEELKSLCDTIINEINQNEDKITDIFIKCAKYIPERLSIYTSLMGLINIKNQSFKIYFIENLMLELKECLFAGDFDDVKFMMRFLADGINVGLVHVNSFLRMLENFSAEIVRSSGSTQNKSDWFAYVILYCLPHCAKRLIEDDEAIFKSILSTVQDYISNRALNHVQSLRVWNSDDPNPQEDMLEVLSSQIESLAEAEWPENICWKLHQSMPILRSQKCTTPFVPIKMGEFDATIKFPLASVVFRMFDNNDVINFDEEDEEKESPVLPGSHTIERFLIDEEIQIILESLSSNLAQCSKALLELKTLVLVPLEYLIVENIFGSIFNLPKPKVSHGHLFYGSLLLQLCKDNQNMIPLILAQATEMIFERLDFMKPVCIERFIEWFSYHLINFQIQWSWNDWSYALNEDAMSARKRFIAETLSRLVRFSYYDNIKRKIPKSFQCLLPADPDFNNRYGNQEIKLIGSIPFSKTLSAIRSRMDSEELSKLIDKSCRQATIRYETGEMSDGENEMKNDRQIEAMEDANLPEKRVDDTPHASIRMDNTPHSKRMDSTPNFIRPNQEVSLNSTNNSLPRNIHDDEDDVVNYEYTDAKRKAIDNRRMITAVRRINRPDTDPLNAQETSINRTPSLARNLSPPREPRNEETEAMNVEPSSEKKGPDPKGDEEEMEVTISSLDSGQYDLKVDVFISALMFCGHKTISHTFSLIRRYSNVIRKLIPLSKIEPQVECLHIIRSSWINQSLMIHLIIDHLNWAGYIEPEAVIRWAYSEEMTSIVDYEDKQTPLVSSSAKPPILELYVWECLNAVLKRLGDKVKKISAKLANAAEARALGDSSSESDTNSRDSASSKSDSDSDSNSDRVNRGRNRSPKRKGKTVITARLNKECEFYKNMQTQCVRTFLQKHSKLMNIVESAIAGDLRLAKRPFARILDGALNVPLTECKNPDKKPFPSALYPEETVMNIFFWLKGRLEQVLLDHYDQFLCNMDIVEEYLNEEKSQSTFFRTILNDWKTLHVQ